MDQHRIGGLSREKRQILDARLQSLDKEKGLGIFPELAREITEGQKLLIVSYGGTGADVLYDLKICLKKTLTKASYENRVRLLAVDTDKETQVFKRTMRDEQGMETMVTESRFENSEFFWLDNRNARMVVSSDSPSLKPWVNPEVVSAILADNTYLDGNGASSTRQVGRIALHPASTYLDFSKKVGNLIHELTDDSIDKLRIIVISGISGGTGSGIVIDATYIIHSVVESINGMSNRTKFCGFLLLPPTGTSENAIDIEKGNRNGYAALKEIDHFMTIKYREEGYSHCFDAKRLESNANIFDTCYLIDGCAGEVNLSQPREKAKQVVRECILDMVTSLPVQNNALTNQTIDSFMSDAAQYAETMVAGASHLDAPRQANYVYCAVGHGKALIPLSLMKAYVGARVFDKVYKLFLRCSEVDNAAVEEFVRTIVPKNGTSAEDVRASIDEELEKVFIEAQGGAGTGGPYYAINLCNRAMELAREKLVQEKSRAIVIDRAKHERLLENYDFAVQYLLHLNNTLFSVYVELMEQLKHYMDEESDIITDSQKYENYTGTTTYTFSLVDFTGANQRAAVVKQYLDKLISNTRIDRLVEDLLMQMIKRENRAQWTELVGKDGNQARFDGANLLREFWDKHISAIVDDTIEDYLIKLYSGDPNAEYVPDPVNSDKPSEQSAQWLTKAAQEIVKQLVGGAGTAVPLAALRDHVLHSSNFNEKTYILIPQAASHLKPFIQAELNNIDGNKFEPLSSAANDRISCFKQYSGLPAFMFSWTLKAESAYEDAVNRGAPGLHMSETAGGELWKNYPNLIPEDVWPQIRGAGQPAHHCVNEEKICDSVRNIFARSLALGLGTVKTYNTVYGYYELAYLSANSGYGLDDALIQAVDSQFKNSTAYNRAKAELDAAVTNRAEALFGLRDWEHCDTLDMKDMYSKLLELAPKAFGTISLKYVHTVMTPKEDVNGEKYQGWEEKLAADLLRQSPKYIAHMRSTVLVLEKLYEMIKGVQAKKELLCKFADYLSYGLLEYSEEYMCWSYQNEEGAEEVLLTMRYNDEVQKSAEYYFLFEKYLEKADSVDAGLRELIENKIEDGLPSNPDHKKRVECQKKLSEDRTKLLEELKKKLTLNREARDQLSIVTSITFRKSVEKRDLDADKIIEFFKNLQTLVENGKGTWTRQL